MSNPQLAYSATAVEKPLDLSGLPTNLGPRLTRSWFRAAARGRTGSCGGSFQE